MLWAITEANTLLLRRSAGFFPAMATVFALIAFCAYQTTAVSFNLLPGIFLQQAHFAAVEFLVLLAGLAGAYLGGEPSKWRVQAEWLTRAGAPALWAANVVTIMLVAIGFAVEGLLLGAGAELILGSAQIPWAVSMQSVVIVGSSYLMWGLLGYTVAATSGDSGTGVFVVCALMVANHLGRVFLPGAVSSMLPGVAHSLLIADLFGRQVGFLTVVRPIGAELISRPVIASAWLLLAVVGSALAMCWSKHH
ncbi:MAG: hypothetical protein LBV30_07605 [Propionibacteriaceae bacterium]|jgi:hypothetical protein|nr:hypothetical protein [Propionibacteriaceae bacterium]